MAPPGVSVHAARVTARAPWATWDDDRTDVVLAPDLARGAAQFAGMELAAVVLAHSSSSIAGGEGWDAAAVRALGKALPEGIQPTTNGQDCVLALKAVGITRPFVVFPPWFGDPALPPGMAYLSDHGFAPVGQLRQNPGQRWSHLPPGDLYPQQMHMAQDVGDLYRQIVAACPAEADGVLIFGTGLRCVGLIEPLETALNRPVVTANQASLWRCLEIAGIAAPVTGYGRLLSLPR